MRHALRVLTLALASATLTACGTAEATTPEAATPEPSRTCDVTLVGRKLAQGRAEMLGGNAHLVDAGRESGSPQKYHDAIGVAQRNVAQWVEYEQNMLGAAVRADSLQGACSAK